MIRHAIATDAAAIARVQNASWRATYRGVIWQRTLDHLNDERSTQSWLHWFMSGQRGSLCLVATDPAHPGRVIGYAMSRAARADKPDAAFGRAEIQVLYLAPSHVRAGLGRQLVAASAISLEKRGYRSLQIWSLANNPSRPFYDRLGGSVINTRRTWLADQELDEVCYHWPALVPLMAMRADVVSH